MNCIKCGKPLCRKHGKRKLTGYCKNCFVRMPSEETKRKTSMALRGEKNPMFGKPSTRKKGMWYPSEEVKIKMSKAKKGKKISEETRKKRWKGGLALSRKREKAKRRLLGFEALNQEFEGSEGHHIDRTHVIFIPKELHRSVWHSLDKPETMEQINTKVFCWLLGKTYEEG